MGNKSSSPADLESRPGMPSLKDPFPVSDRVTTVLRETTTIMDRLLTTGDVFDMSGAMKKMSDDTCGGYVFFLAKQFEKTILAASVKNEGTPHQIVYQSTTQAVKDRKLRDKICLDVTDLSLRAIMTVIALIASIQVGETGSRMNETVGPVLMLGSRSGSGAGAGYHGGGGHTGTRKRARDARRLTHKRAFQRDAIQRDAAIQRGGVVYFDEAGNEVTETREQDGKIVDAFYGRPLFEEYEMPDAPPVDFDVTCIERLERLHAFLYKKRHVDGDKVKNAKGGVTHKITKPAEIKSPYTFRITYDKCDQKEKDYIRASVKSMATRKVDVETTKQPRNDLKLKFLNPVKLKDDRRRDGRSTEVVPFSISTNSERVLFAGLLVEDLFCMGFPTRSAAVDDRKPLYLRIYDSFKLAEELANNQRDPNSETHRSQGDTFKHLYDRGTDNLPANILTALGSRGIELLGLRSSGPLGQVDRVPVPMDLDLRKKEMFRFTGQTVSLVSTKFGDKLNTVRNLYLMRSSPARVRAKTLAGVWNPATREQTTGVCSDSYWITDEKKTLESIFPWATLQFLYIQNMSAYAKADVPTLETEAWKTDFLTPLRGVYSGEEQRLPSIAGSETLLSKLRFTPASQKPLCTNSAVSAPIIQAGINAFYEIYNAHVTAVVEILNNLVQVLKDPETNVDMIRLHSKVAQSEDSAAYVKEQTKKAREAISKFYVDIEKEYANYLLQLTQSNNGPVSESKSEGVVE